MSSLAPGDTARAVISIQTWGSLTPSSALLTLSFTAGSVAYSFSRRGLFSLPISMLLHCQFFSPHSYFFSLDVESYRFFMGHRYFLRRQTIDFANT